MLRSFFLSTVYAIAMAPLAANAAPWVVDTAQSKLQFSGTQTGDAFTGGFHTFTPVIALDLAHPEKGHIDVTIDITSGFIANDTDKNAALLTDEWFGAKQFPKAEFHSTAIRQGVREKSVGPGLDVDGTLTLRGITKPINLYVDLVPQKDGSVVARGNATLKRNDFSIGQGSYATDKYIAYPVQVNFVIVATPGK